MIYLDNGATTFPKPREVYTAVARAFHRCGGNPGRGSHEAARLAADCIYDARLAASELFSCDVENVVLTYNATHALNLAIKGLATKGTHVLISDIEHNSVRRPVAALEKTHGITFGVFQTFGGDRERLLASLENVLTDNTSMVVSVHTSNICGITLPVSDIAKLCRRRGITYIVDASQSAGHLPIDFSALGADAVCMAGHKGLYGPAGTGLLLLRDGIEPETVIEGGSGIDSLEVGMPALLPERLEAGTLSAQLAAGLAAGIRWVSRVGVNGIRAHEGELSRILAEELTEMRGVTLYGYYPERDTSTVLFDLNCVSPTSLAAQLDTYGICVRAGLHCAPLAHRTLGTPEDGAVRVSFGYFNKREHVKKLVDCLRRVRKS